MGQEISGANFTTAEFRGFLDRLAAETEQLFEHARRGDFADPRYRIGFELEAWLLDHTGSPNAVNERFLQRLNDPLVVPELSRFNVELNGPPIDAGAGMLDTLEAGLSATWARCQQVAHGMDSVLAVIGILPTIREADLCLANMSALNRYNVLNAQVLRQRDGAPIHIDIDGEDRLVLERRDVMLEAATTSFQLHLQVPFVLAARHYNAALIASAPLLAVAENSPLLFGKRLWRETRVPLFEQAIELGGYGGLADSDVRRVGFGRGYVAGDLLELFRENLADFPVLLPVALSEPPERYPHVRLHNGCIWRWLRPLIGFDARGTPHVRLEQRVLPAGPTLLDMLANSAFHFGLTHALACAQRPPEEGLSYADARANFYAAARAGLGARLRWLDGEPHATPGLILDHCLPLARRGLEDFGLAADEIARYLEVIAARVRDGQTGSEWQLRALRRHGGDAPAMMRDYLENQRAGAPVHEWSV